MIYFNRQQQVKRAKSKSIFQHKKNLSVLCLSQFLEQLVFT
jgi:hypothetical protein